MNYKRGSVSLLLMFLLFIINVKLSADDYADMSNIIVINTSEVEIDPGNIKIKYRNARNYVDWDQTLGGYDATTIEKEKTEINNVYYCIEAIRFVNDNSTYDLTDVGQNIPFKSELLKMKISKTNYNGDVYAIYISNSISSKNKIIKKFVLINHNSSSVEIPKLYYDFGLDSRTASFLFFSALSAQRGSDLCKRTTTGNIGLEVKDYEISIKHSLFSSVAEPTGTNAKTIFFSIDRNEFFTSDTVITKIGKNPPSGQYAVGVEISNAGEFERDYGRSSKNLNGLDRSTRKGKRYFELF